MRSPVLKRTNEAKEPFRAHREDRGRIATEFSHGANRTGGKEQSKQQEAIQTSATVQRFGAKMAMIQESPRVREQDVVQREGDNRPTLVNVAPAPPPMPQEAARGAMLESFGRMSPQGGKALKIANATNLAADIAGGIIAVVSTGIGFATAGASAVVTGPLTTALTLVLKEIENQHLEKAIAAVNRISKYAAGEATVKAFAAIMSEFETQISRNEVKKLKAELTFAIPGSSHIETIAGLLEFAISKKVRSSSTRKTGDAAREVFGEEGDKQYAHDVETSRKIDAFGLVGIHEMEERPLDVNFAKHEPKGFGRKAKDAWKGLKRKVVGEKGGNRVINIKPAWQSDD